MRFNVGSSPLGNASACDGRKRTQLCFFEFTLTPAPIVRSDRSDRHDLSAGFWCNRLLNGYQMAITDSSGNYTVAAARGMTFVEADNYATDYRYVGGTPHNVHLIPSSGSRQETRRLYRCARRHAVRQQLQDSPIWSDYVCRSVRVVAPSAGVMTLEALSTTNGPPPLLEVEIVTGGRWTLLLRTPREPHLDSGHRRNGGRGTVEMPVGSATSQTFTLNTSMRPR